MAIFYHRPITKADSGVRLREWGADDSPLYAIGGAYILHEMTNRTEPASLLCSPVWRRVSIKQKYAGHAKQWGPIACQCTAGACANRLFLVVDDDIEPADMDQVVWAMCTRFDPREGMETLRGCWSTALDPMAYGSDDPRNARVVIDACKPWSRRDSFPRVARATQELVDRIRTKWSHVLPRG